MAEVCVPAPAASLPVFKSATSVQPVPFQDSVRVTLYTFGGVLPPKAKAEVLLTPAAPASSLVVFKSPTSVQPLPYQDSFITGKLHPSNPPKANADV